MLSTADLYIIGKRSKVKLSFLSEGKNMVSSRSASQQPSGARNVLDLKRVILCFAVWSLEHQMIQYLLLTRDS